MLARTCIAIAVGVTVNSLVMLLVILPLTDISKKQQSRQQQQQ
jgi:hypothetical protein